MIKLSPVQKQILAIISMNCRVQAEEVARQISARPHQVRHTIERLKDLLNLSPYCFTNPFRRGLVPYHIFFSINSADLSRRTKMLEHLRSRPEVVWLHELYGYYQFFMYLRVRDSQQLNSFFHDFDTRFGSLVVSKSLSEVSRNSFFVPWLAHDGNTPRPCLEYRAERPSLPLNSIDNKILESLRRAPQASFRDIARTVGQPASTICYRINRLLKLGVIITFPYDYDTRLIGGESFLVLVKLNGLGGALSDSFFDFARQHPRINRIARLFGEWDLEIEIDLDNPHNLSQVIHQIYKHGSGSVQNVLSHSWGVSHSAAGRPLA